MSKCKWDLYKEGNVSKDEYIEKIDDELFEEKSKKNDCDDYWNYFIWCDDHSSSNVGGFFSEFFVG